MIFICSIASPSQQRQVCPDEGAGQGLINFLATAEGEAACSWTMVQAASNLAIAVGVSDLQI